jgi:hypothetical protein
MSSDSPTVIATLVPGIHTLPPPPPPRAPGEGADARDIPRVKSGGSAWRWEAIRCCEVVAWEPFR